MALMLVRASTPLHLTGSIAAFVDFFPVFLLGMTFYLPRTVLLQRDIGLVNVSLRREPWLFLCECCEVGHECDSVMAGLRATPLL